MIVDNSSMYYYFMYEDCGASARRAYIFLWSICDVGDEVWMINLCVVAYVCFIKK